MIRILVHDDNDISHVTVHFSRGVDEFQARELMIVNA